MTDARAETHVRLLAEDQLRRAVTSPRYRWLDEDFREGGEPPDEVGLLRVRAVLSALRQVGALSRATAARLAGEFTSALAARGFHEAGALLSTVRTAGMDQPAAAGPAAGAAGATAGTTAGGAASPGAGAPGGRYQAVPVGTVILAEREGHQGEVHVQALVLAPGRAAIVTTFISTWREPARTASGAPLPQPAFPPFGGSGLTDDQGRSYRLSLEVGEGGWLESGLLNIVPVPPADVRWLDMPTGPATRTRIDLTAPAPAATVRSEPSAPATVGGLLLVAVAETMLGGGPMPGIAATQLASGLGEVTAALEAVHALPPDSAAAAHLAALCQRRAIEVRGPLAERARTVPLPVPWASVLSRGRPSDGPPGAAPVVAVLPELDGARFVLAGLVSGERHASVLVFAWGWEPQPREFRPRQPFSWWARDDAGRWHVGRASAFNSVAGTFHLELQPPLHPGIRSLDIILTGTSRRVTATMPIAWARPETGPD